MRKVALHACITLIVMIVSLMMFQGCAKKPVVQEDVARAPQAEKAVQAPRKIRPSGKTRGIRPNWGKRFRGSASTESGKAERLGYFVVSTPRDYVFMTFISIFDKYAVRAEDRDASTAMRSGSRITGDMMS